MTFLFFHFVITDLFEKIQAEIVEINCYIIIVLNIILYITCL